ncbi:unnamed protein product [Closterium sp. NIES-65]|nr:unnamed protein product [Closterium sp. NIES-65]
MFLLSSSPIPALAYVAAPPRTLSQDEIATVRLFKETTPSVVNITNLGVGRDALTLDVLAVPQGSGSGFIWDEMGHIVTNYHVIANAADLRILKINHLITQGNPLRLLSACSGCGVRRGQGHSSVHAAVVVGCDEDKDVAVLRIDAPQESLHPVTIGSSSDLMVGQRVFAIGNPVSHTLNPPSLTHSTLPPLSLPHLISPVLHDPCWARPHSHIRRHQRFEERDPISSNRAANTGDQRHRGADNREWEGGAGGAGDLLCARRRRWRSWALTGCSCSIAPPSGPAGKAGLRPTSRDNYGRLVLGDIITAIDNHKVRSGTDLYRALDDCQVGDTKIAIFVITLACLAAVGFARPPASVRAGLQKIEKNDVFMGVYQGSLYAELDHVDGADKMSDGYAYMAIYNLPPLVKMASVLLPTSVKPKKYVLHLEPNLETFKFKGIVTVDLDVVEPTNEIRFHAQELELHKVELTTGGKLLTAGVDGVPAVELDKERQEGKLVLGEGQTMSTGPAKLRIEYTGITTTTWSASTPAAKATFEVSLRVPTGLQGLSNMDEVGREKQADGSEVVRFAESPVMSTYLLAFVVGEVECVSDKTSNGTLVNIYTTPGRKEQGRFALSVACKVITFFEDYFGINIPQRTLGGAHCKVITFFEEYFGIKYPLPKADLIAIPDFAMGAMENRGLITFRETALSCVPTLIIRMCLAPFPLYHVHAAIPDFAMGAMENWGLITFRETALLLDENSAPAATKQRVAYVISHELAHQWFGNLVTMQWWNDLWLNEGFATWWFGNLVTMQWWNDLWLNEGFATWVGWLGVDYIFPEVGTCGRSSACNDMDTCLHTDALLGSHPVEVPINDPKEIEQVFDALSYSKGACVIRQLESAIGADAFKKVPLTYSKGACVIRQLEAAIGADAFKKVSLCCALTVSLCVHSQ